MCAFPICFGPVILVFVVLYLLDPNQIIFSKVIVTGFSFGTMVLLFTMLKAWFNTSYLILENSIEYVFGFRSGSIKIDEIRVVKKSTYTTSGKRPALSTSGLAIYYGQAYQIFISPKRQDQFIARLKSKNGQITLK